MQKTFPQRPWYKERWPWLLMAGPAIAVVAGIITFNLAVQSDDGLVSDDYYKRGKEINRELRRDEAATQMGLTAQVLFDPAMQRVMVTTTSRTGLPDRLRLQLIHPAQDDYDQTITLQRTGPNAYAGTVKPASANHWYVRLEDEGNQWRVQGEWKPQEGAGVVLGQPALEKVE
ncbi:Uncharacterized protein Ga0061063_2712 [Gulbenkiania indica]|uniref:Nitrogen fixation protein FixH n=1 Tax=Gulbenkiania indica TaxID=375574 RepID=A0A0K6H6K9_9NEIS|nr:FixH family protein [Gulbenkiania indica]CUA86543.1 Uncharacterized protein Ga0061063_2712 [Gulbenkiania indica]